MNYREKSKFALCLTIMVLTLSLPALWGCQNAMVYDNTKIGFLDAMNQTQFAMPGVDSMAGSLAHGDSLVIYNCLDDNNHELMVWDPDLTPTPGYIQVNGNETAAALVIKKYFLKIRPGNIAYQYVDAQFTYPSGDTDKNNPQLEIGVFTYPEGAGTLHTFELSGVYDGHTTIYISGPDDPRLDTTVAGRTFIVREADPDDDIAPNIAAISSNLSDDPDDLGDVVTSADEEFVFYTTEKLGLLYAAAARSTHENDVCTETGTNNYCYDDSAVIMNLSYVHYDISTGYYEYVFVPKPTRISLDGSGADFGTLVDGDWVLMLAVEVDNTPSAWTALLPGKPQKGTQDMSGNLITHTGHAIGEVNSVTITGTDDNGIQVLPYFFTVDLP